MPLRFHWMLPKAGEVAVAGAEGAANTRLAATRDGSPAARTDMAGWTRFALAAEEAGIESLLISFSRYEPDPLMVACALGRATTRLAFLAAYRSGLILPTTFVQQVNTASNLIGGRIALNVVAGSSAAEQRGYGDFLDHDRRYARAEEFLAVCRRFWDDPDGAVDFRGEHYRVEGGRLHTRFEGDGRRAPEIYVSGHSAAAERLALAQGSCWLRVADTPEKLSALVARTRERGVEVCLRLCLICRPRREDAVGAAMALLPGGGVGDQRDSVEAKADSLMYRQARDFERDSSWLDRCLWAGLVPHNGPVWITLVGTPAELAEAFLAYGRIGVTQFIISGWPELDEMVEFGRRVVPLVRRAEGAAP